MEQMGEALSQSATLGLHTAHVSVDLMSEVSAVAQQVAQGLRG